MSRPEKRTLDFHIRLNASDRRMIDAIIENRLATNYAEAVRYALTTSTNDIIGIESVDTRFPEKATGIDV